MTLCLCSLKTILHQAVECALLQSSRFAFVFISSSYTCIFAHHLQSKIFYAVSNFSSFNRCNAKHVASFRCMLRILYCLSFHLLTFSVAAFYTFADVTRLQTIVRAIFPSLFESTYFCVCVCVYECRMCIRAVSLKWCHLTP